MLADREGTNFVKMFKLICVVALLCCLGLVSGHHMHPRCLPMLGKYPFDSEKVRTTLQILMPIINPLG